MKKFCFFLAVFFSQNLLFAQISQVQKDSAVKLLYFKGTNYEYKISFNPYEYVGDDYTLTFNNEMTDEQILAKLNNTFQDAEAYVALCYRFYDKKDMKTASEYFDKAMENLKSWADAENTNPKPVMIMLDLCSYTRSYQAFDKLVPKALKSFPKNIFILSRVFMHTLLVQNNPEKAENLLNQALAIEPYHLTNVANWVALQEFRYLTDLIKSPSQMPKSMDISLAEKAFKNNSKSLAYEHLYYYALTMKIYLNLMAKFFLKKSDNPDALFKEISKEEKKQLQTIDKFFKKSLPKASKSKNTMLANVAFVNIFLGNYKEAISFFEQINKETPSKNTSEAIVLTHFLDKNWKAMEANLVRILEKEPDDMRTLIALVSLYDKYDKNETKLKATLLRIEQTSTSDPMRSLILATWYLKQKNLERADFYCDLLSEASKEELLCLAVQAVLKNDKSRALNLIEKILNLDKEYPEAIKLKKILEK